MVIMSVCGTEDKRSIRFTAPPFFQFGGVAELVDAPDLGSGVRAT